MMNFNFMHWKLLLAVTGLCLLAACGSGGSGLEDSDLAGKSFSLTTESTAGSGHADLDMQVLRGDEFTDLQISASNAVELKDLLLHIEYDPERFSPYSQRPTSLLGEEDDLLQLTMDREPGTLHFGVASVRNGSEGFSGNGMVAEIRFANTPFSMQREASGPPALGNAAAEIDYNNLTGQLSWFYANPGDTNQDGLVNLADLVPIARDFKATGPFATSSVTSVADANGDGEVNISDVSVLGANWNNDAFGGFNVYSSDLDGSQGSVIGNVAFSNATGDPSAERLRFSYQIPNGQRMSFAWVQPVDGEGMTGLSGDAVFANVVINGPTASFGNKTGGGSGSSADPFVVGSGENMPFAAYDPEDGDITHDPGLNVWLEPAVAGSISNGVLQVSDSYNGAFVMRGSYQNESVELLAAAKTSSELSVDGGDGAFFQIDGCLELRLDDPELEGNGSVWHPYKVTSAGETLDFSVWHCDLGDISNSEQLSWGWQPENAGEFGWDNKKFTFFQQFTGLWVIEVQYEAEGMFASDHLYFNVDPQGNGGESGLVLKVLDGFVDGSGKAENPYIICDTTREVGFKAWHSELGDVTTSDHLDWLLEPGNAGEIHPEWHQINIAENFLGEFSIEISWETAGEMLSDRRYFKVQECEPGGDGFEIKVGEGISGGEGSQENPYKVCVNEVWEFYIKAWHDELGDVTSSENTSWSWTPENAGYVSPQWHQFNMAEEFTGFFSIHAVYEGEGGVMEDTKYFKALECENTESFVEIEVFSGYVDGNGSQEHPFVICSDTHEFGVKGLHSELGNITTSELSTWIVDSPSAGVMHPEWKQFNVAAEFLGNFIIKLKYGTGDDYIYDIRHFVVVECEEEAHLELDTDLVAITGNGSQEAPFKFCRDDLEEIYFEVFHSELGNITLNEHLSWTWEPGNAGEFRPDFSDFVVNYEFIGVFAVTARYQTEEQTLTSTLWFKQVECELPEELTLVVTNPPQNGEGTEANPYVYLENPIEIGLKFLHPELGDITDNESVSWNWNPENAGEFRPQWNDFRVGNEFSGSFWISATWPSEGGDQTRKVYIVIGNQS